MTTPFLSHIRVNEIRHLKNINIPISPTPKHLIFTGINGSGKTTLLTNLRNFFLAKTQGWKYGDQNTIKIYQSYNGQIHNLRNNIKQSSEQKRNINIDYNYLDGQSINIENYQKQLKYYENISNYLLNIVNGLPLPVEALIENEHSLINLYQSADFIINFFDAKRDSFVGGTSNISNNTYKRYGILSHAGADFLQYVINLRAEQSFARDDNDHRTVNHIQDWFNRFTNQLRLLYNNNDLTFLFDRKLLNFFINVPGRHQFDLNSMSDGYASILSIVTDILLRMETRTAYYNNPHNFEVAGIIIIDEIETHLHIALQKKVLPFLTAFFPNIQFIVSTHSPFVLNSISNTVVYDLEKQTRFEDLSGYSMEGLVESYFQQDKYSDEVKQLVTEYERLAYNQNKSHEENTRLIFLKKYFEELPKFYSNELTVKIQQIELDTMI